MMSILLLFIRLFFLHPHVIAIQTELKIYYLNNELIFNFSINLKNKKHSRVLFFQELKTQYELTWKLSKKKKKRGKN